MQNKIQNYTRINDILAKNEADTAYTNEKKEAAEKKINQIQTGLNQKENAMAYLSGKSYDKLASGTAGYKHPMSTENGLWALLSSALALFSSLVILAKVVDVSLIGLLGSHTHSWTIVVVQ